ncbi:MAG: phage Gp37/Gp68 family protein [Candidatus Electrothrix sp. LOE2]|nr:phage Gp37/Gp68 family protein [Candidatus Electrothrix sp. LOE2]
MKQSKIEWTETTWNPITGCTKVSLGCKNCYAERMAYRLQSMGSPNYKNGFKLTCHESQLHAPLKWKKGKIVFVNSMSDLFHKDVPENFIKRIFETMRMASHHQFQILTKRSERLLELNKTIKWAPNIWMGVSVENADYLYRVDHLRQTGAAIKFLSIEPLLGPLSDLNLESIDWVIVGGESGPHARPIQEEWVEAIKKQCIEKAVPFFFKQWGGVNKKKTGRTLKGEVWSQMPDIPTRRSVFA